VYTTTPLVDGCSGELPKSSEKPMKITSFTAEILSQV